jgi:hypothetical protein
MLTHQRFELVVLNGHLYFYYVAKLCSVSEFSQINRGNSRHWRRTYSSVEAPSANISGCICE